MSFDAPALLWLLPLALLPLWATPGRAVASSWPAQLPRDWPSELMQWALRLAAVVALAALAVGLAGPHRPEALVDRVGRGAEIVLVLDRSRSMDQGFAGARSAPPAGARNGPEALAYYSQLRAKASLESKGMVARQLLAEFAARRPDDRFAMEVFSTVPMKVLEFTQKPEVIQAAISAGNIGRGLSETNIGLALQAGLGHFRDRPYTGSRILLLVSDGGDRLDPDARELITRAARQMRVGIYWIYIRAQSSPGLMLGQAVQPTAAEAESIPEVVLHQFFESLGVPYRAYEADNPEALQAAMADVNRLENLPMAYQETLPRQDLSAWAYATALGAVLLLLGANLLELRP